MCLSLALRVPAADPRINSLVLVPMLTIESPTGLMLTIESPTGLINQIQFATNLVQRDWTVVTNLHVLQSPYGFVAPTMPRVAAGFYRVVGLPIAPLATPLAAEGAVAPAFTLPLEQGATVPANAGAALGFSAGKGPQGVGSARAGPVDGRAGEAVPAVRRHIRVTVVCQLWSDEGRTLPAVVAKINQAVTEGTDVIVLPMECVKTDGEPIPGPISRALAAESREHQVYIVGNIREVADGKTYITSFLSDRTGKLVGKYRKSHKLPDETMDLGNELPVFQTEFGKVAMRIGSDRFFPEIDHVYTTQGASLICWAQQPEPVDDEYAQDFPTAGRGYDYAVNIACARYASATPGWITSSFPPFCGMPLGRSYVINREGQRVASTPRTGVGMATATLSKGSLREGRQVYTNAAFAALTAPVVPVPDRPWVKRTIRATALGSLANFDSLLAALDEAGRLGTDIACTFEHIWITGQPPESIASKTAVAKARNSQVAAKARQWNMYVILAGVVDRLERNEAILYGRDGREVGRYSKLVKTHPEMIPGTNAPVFETDFGRVAVRICADEEFVELDRCYALQGVDILFTPTASWAPDAQSRELRDLSRAMDGGFFLVEATSPSTEHRHRSLIADPTGTVVASSEYRKRTIATAVLDLNNDRPLRYTRVYTPYQPTGNLPEYQPNQLPTPANDLRATVLRQRRPELYGVLGGGGSVAR
ncbi:hypothetical protein LBMAG56_12710 [Verrucomicrobiota bacterium]|nr:hypothetical protein LBMAG56_12710 [Verrucomicrobiota bacterium]